MKWRCWASFGLFALAAVLPPRVASAQLEPMGGYYAPHASDTGFSSLVNSSGGYGASIPLDLPAARNGLPVPVQINYGERGVGAAGRGWDVPLSFIRRDRTLAQRRPVATPGAPPAPRERVSLVLAGRSMELVRTATGWVARQDATDIAVRENSDGTWVMFDGQGRAYRFAAVSTALAEANLWLLQDVSGPGGNSVHLDYHIATPSLPGGTGVSIDLAGVSYNPSPTTAGCYKSSVTLTYDADASAPLSLSMVGSLALARFHKLVSVEVYSKESCGVSPTLLRQYQLSYQADPDTQQPRLSSVSLRGRAGTAENNTPIAVASYSYGAATTGGVLAYQSMPFSGLAEGQLGRTAAGVAGPRAETGSSTSHILVDATGDGMPDLLKFESGGLFIQRNRSASSIAFGAVASLNGGDMSSRALETGTTRRHEYLVWESTRDESWRQVIDVNGDGRVDVVDAGERPGHWNIYVNTPDPAAPSGVRWVRRSYSITWLAQQLRDRGHAIDPDYLPLARRATRPQDSVLSCWQWNGFAWNEDEDGFQQGLCKGYTGPYEKTTITEWELKDVNGDGYPDVVFNSSPVVVTTTDSPFPENPKGGQHFTVVSMNTQVLAAGEANRIQAAFNVLGMHMRDADDQPFSAVVTLRSNDGCGVSRWYAPGVYEDTPSQLSCDLADVNGDGIVDRVRGTSVFLGTGLVSPGYFTSGAMLTLPGPLAVRKNPHHNACLAPATTSTLTETQMIAALRDLTGDGLPDHVAQDGNGNWNVSIGTGTGFRGAIPVNAVGFGLSLEIADCGYAQSSTASGLFDLNGDGKPEVVKPGSGGYVLSLVGASGVPGVPEAGRMVQTDNGYGAVTTIRYRSVKGDFGIVHQVPFPEVLVDSVETTDGYGLGGKLSAMRYAYGGAELVYDPALDLFTFPGYRRRVELQTPVDQPAGVATIVITDLYGAFSATNPYGLALDSTQSAEQRYGLYHRIGRVSDVTVLSGYFGPASIADPSNLLTINVTSDGRRIGATHYDWSTRLLAASSDPAGPEPCSELVFPYDEADSSTFNALHAGYNPCTAHGFAFASSVQSWRGEPGAAPPSSAHVATRSEVLDVDGFGRVLRVKHLNDLYRSEDDLCVDTTYAAPTGSDERVLFAASSRTVSDCAGTTLAKDRWEYDGLAAGSVSGGFATTHFVERRDDTGALLGTIREFFANLNSIGNPWRVTTSREDGATRVVTIEYDPFGLAPTRIITNATGAASTQVSITRDPLTLNVLSSTDPNKTVRGATYDGFDRQVLSTVTVPGGASGAMSVTRYEGFTSYDPAGRRIVQKVFSDPVAPATVEAAAGRTSTLYLDELGRARKTELALGTDYFGATLVVGHRTYDAMGRVVFEADPYPQSQDAATAFGTTQFFRADGTLHCVARAPGRQATVLTATAFNAFPTCFQRSYQGNTEVLSVQDADALAAGSPQAGVMRSSYRTAIGRVLSRATWQGASRLEYATFAHDRLGHQTSMTRFQDPDAGAKPVTSSWRYDSLGWLLELDEPDSAPQYQKYSDWGELLEVGWNIGATGGSGYPRAVVNKYDGLGRIIHSEQRINGVVDPETVNDYLYDVAVQVAPQVIPTNMLGRLSHATSPTGSVSFSYDGFGGTNAQTFTDLLGGTYVEKHTYHADGNPSALDLYLPDTAFANEHVAYQYDSAGHGRSVTYTSGTGSKTLYAANRIDAFGRVREATFGAAAYTANYEETGRRLPKSVRVGAGLEERSYHSWLFDPVGRETFRVDQKFGEITSSYDALGRLSSAVSRNGDAVTYDESFGYDPLGNITTKSRSVPGLSPVETSLTYLDTDRDRICRIRYGGDAGTACNVTYDQVGNIIAQATATGQRQFSYLPSGQVRTISDDLGNTATYRYDAFGEVQELDLQSGDPSHGRRDRRYGGLLAWRDVINGTGTSSILSRKIPGPDGFMASRRGPGGPWVFEFGEPRGSRFFVDETGAFVQDIEYSPYGEPKSTGAAPGSILYTNEQWNGGDSLEAFGISHLGARLYDPAIGRFLSRDPLLIPLTAATSNPYSFAMNDPVNASDPTGLETKEDRPGTVRPPEIRVRELPGIPLELIFGPGPAPVDRDAGPAYDGGGGRVIVRPGTNGGQRRGSGGAAGQGSAPAATPGPGPLSPAFDSGAFRSSATSAGMAGLRADASRAAANRIVLDDLPSMRTVILDGSPESWSRAKASAAGGGIGLGLVGGGLLIGSFGTVGATAVASPEIVGTGVVAAKLAQSEPVQSVCVRGGAAIVRVGQAGEAAVRALVDIGEKVKILVNGNMRIPDGLTENVLSEVKNVGKLSFTSQLRDFLTFAQANGLRFDLWVRPTTVLSGPLLEQANKGAIQLRYIP